MPANLSSAGFEFLSKGTVGTGTGNNATSRAIQQYHQSPFAIQQLLGLTTTTTNTNTANSSREEVKDDRNMSKMASSPAHSTHSSNTSNTESTASNSGNNLDDHNLSLQHLPHHHHHHHNHDSKLMLHDEHSRGSSSISVASHGTISPAVSPKNPIQSSLSVTNLVNNNNNNSNNHHNPTNGTFNSYFSSRNTSQQQQQQSQQSQQQQQQPLSLHPVTIAGTNQFDSVSPSSNGRIPYFNTQAAAALMSAASMHVGLQQVTNSMAKNHGPFGGNNAISSMFHPFASDVAKFNEKTSPGKYIFFIYSSFLQ